MKQPKTSKTQELDEIKSKYLRALADYQNLEKRFYNEKNEAEKQIARRILENFLFVMDDLERAQVFSQDESLAMIARQFRTVFENLGVVELEVAGKPFDPYTAEAIEMTDGEEDGKVIEVIRKGYKMNDLVLRPAQVKVSKLKIKN